MIKIPMVNENRKQKKFFTKNKLIKIKSMSDFMSRKKQLCAHVFYFSCPIVSNRNRGY